MNNLLKENVKEFLDVIEKYFFKSIILTNESEESIGKILRKILVLINHSNIREIIDSFIFELPAIKKQVEEDLGFFMISDPAIKSIDEVIICYLSFRAIWIYRISHYLDTIKVKILPRYLSEYAHMISGIDIHPGATISSPFFIDHGTGIVIGETTIIGHHVKIYQGVTLGAKSLANIEKAKKEKRHPTIGNYVTIYADAKVLGGKTHIKDYSVIKCNQVIIE